MMILPITRVVDETADVKTFSFAHALRALPGQFVMVWIPGCDQKPMSVSFDDGATFGLTICRVGEFTKRLFAMKQGDRLGIEGPYGTSFSVEPRQHTITVAGGYGAGPLALLAERLALAGSAVDYIVGARTAGMLLFESRCAKLANTAVSVATDDGSRGYAGPVTDLLAERLAKYPNAHVAACGPEGMEKKVLELCNDRGVSYEISIERYMKCGTGLCGQCAVDDLGLRLCINGPVVSRDVANAITEFGVYHRDKSGKKIPFAPRAMRAD